MMSASIARPVSCWLLICCAMVFVMALLGAVTRLTESGLAITAWQPIMGAIPPLTGEDWQRAFAAYQAIPQFQLLHSDMTLDTFKGIYFWEWLHRLWGRLIGVVFAVPFGLFVLRRQIDRHMALKFGLIFLLGGLQGFIGWFMVQSGLEVRTSVSPYRLTLHLGFALLIYSVLLGMALGTQPKRMVSVGIWRHGWLAVALLALTILWGAMVAGMQAGLIYNSWPLMDGQLLPVDWQLGLDNAGLVQFVHRWLGPVTALILLGWVWRCHAILDRWLIALAVMAIGQVGLGLATLLSHVQIGIAVAHQAGAIALLTLVLVNLARLRTSK